MCSGEFSPLSLLLFAFLPLSFEEWVPFEIFPLFDDSFSLLSFLFQSSQKMQGRFFASRTIQAVLSSSKPKFRSSDNQDEDDEDERKEAFGDWLENGGGD